MTLIEHIKAGGKVQTRDGREVRIYATDGHEPSVIHGAIRGAIGSWWPHSWHGSGADRECTPSWDLVPAPKEFRLDRWVNVHASATLDPYSAGYLYSTRDEADRASSPYRIACVKVVIKGVEGAGLQDEG